MMNSVTGQKRGTRLVFGWPQGKTRDVALVAVHWLGLLDFDESCLVWR